MPECWLRISAGLVMLLLLLVAPVARAADQATVFIYHRFGDARYPSTNTSLSDFRAHLETLRSGGYAVLPLGEIAARLRDGRSLPERCVALSVDDAFRSFLTGAVPLLREFGFPATLFVNSGEVGGPDFLTWEELRRLAQGGIEIGNHSAAHDYLLDRHAAESAEEWRRRVRKAVQQAQEELTAHLGVAPKLFAYPYGEFNRELVAIVRELGFGAAVGQQSGVIARGMEPFALPRFPASGDYAAIGTFRERLRFAPLPVTVLEPADTVIGASNPPLLRFKLDVARIDPATMRLHVPGQVPVAARAVDRAGVYECRASAPLSGRRSKYTLTAADREGRWYWFSQLWVRPGR